MTDPRDVIAVAIERIRHFHEANGEALDAAFNAQIVRLISWLETTTQAQPSPPRTLPAMPPPPRDGTRTPTCAVDDRVDQRLAATIAQEVAARHDRDGEVDPEHHAAVVGLTLPGAMHAARPAARMAMTTLQVRAARSAAQVGRVAQLVAITDGALSEMAHEWKRLELDAPARILLPAALYTGLRLAALVRLPVVDSINQVEDGAWGILRTPLALVAPARAAAGLPNPSPDWPCVEVGSHVILPLPMGAAFAQDIKAWLATRESGRPFATRQHARAARDWLVAHAESTGSRVTVRRLPQVLREACAATGLGLAEEALILAHRGRGVNGRASSHYYTASPVEIVRVHAPAIDWISIRLGGRSFLSQPEAVGVTVGARRHPTQDRVIAYMSELREVDTRRGPGRRSDAAVAARHLRFQAVMREGAHWATGCRPFLHALDGLLFAGDVIVIDDKRLPGGAGRAHARAVPVCRHLMRMKRAWIDHRAAMAEHCGMAVEELPPWFVITANRTVRPATWRDLRAPLPPLHMARNASRIFFRSQLSACGLRSPAVDGWAGHVIVGTEPGLPLCSTAPTRFDPQDLALLNDMVDALRLPELED